MIARIWRGRTSLAKADAYEKFLKDMAHPDYGDVKGNRGWLLQRRPLPDSVEFMFVSFWDSMDALRAYAGDDPAQPKYYPEDRAALLELPESVEHFDIVDAQVRF
jgi:heme-degrading monooxygenase HmoA